MTVDGVVVVDKPAGWTSHDVVARLRPLAGTRRVGHAGTLDPAATGVLVVGVGRATRLLGPLARGDKEYLGTIRLGVRTSTDDAQGAVLGETDASGVSDDALAAAIAGWRGERDQVPAAVSAVKVDGVRAYRLARAGTPVELSPRRVTIDAFEVLARRGADVDVRVVCSSGTYVRALARDVGTALGVGAHLATLRRTRVGPFDLTAAHPMDELATEFAVLPLAAVVRAAFPAVEVDATAAQAISHGQRLEAATSGPGPVGLFGPDGAVLALAEPADGRWRYLVVLS
ncbi:MAG TPA: tRNA pseudouridine(55) synthase TruB [Mycobacteriales bacterium]|nr:tRNA pseudouridine(55) synthase TruB [Mycobacteriales bacterium]